MHMSMLSVAVLVSVAVALPASALDMPETKVSMEACMAAALAKADGEVRSLKLEIENGKPLYEFDIETDAGQQWELECDAMTGEIVEMSRTASRNDPEFRAVAKLVERQARAIALERFPGNVTGSDLEMEGERAQYKVEIEGDDGNTYEAIVDAATGEIVASEVESEETTIYEIGD